MAQQVQVQQLSPIAHQIASNYQLGTPTAAFKASLTRSKILSGIGLSLMGIAIIIGGFFISNPDPNTPLIIGIIGLFFLGFGLSPFVLALIQRNVMVLVCTDGLLNLDGSKTEAIRWDQMRSINSAVTRMYVNGVYTGTRHIYTVTKANGTVVKFTDKYHKVADLGTIIENEITRNLLPQVLASYHAGSTITFGQLSVSQQGVSNTRELLPWNQIKGIQVNKGIITIQKEGKWLNWSAVNVSETPNIYLFMALVNYIVNGGK